MREDFFFFFDKQMKGQVIILLWSGDTFKILWRRLYIGK